MSYAKWLAQYHAKASLLGMTYEDAETLRRDAQRLDTINIHEANGNLERCEEEGRKDHRGRPMIVGAVYQVFCHDGPGPLVYYKTRDMETPARARIEAIAARYGATVEWQGDPRGLPVKLILDDRELSPPCRDN